jgi:hypothetical protein
MTGGGVRIRSVRLRLRGDDAGAARRLARQLGEALADKLRTAGAAPGREIRLRLGRRDGEGSGELVRRIVRGLEKGGR